MHAHSVGADLALVDGDLRADDAMRLCRRTLAAIKGNLFWAFAFDIAAIPWDAAGSLQPYARWCGVAFSRIFVVSNSLRLRRVRAAGRDRSSRPHRTQCP